MSLRSVTKRIAFNALARLSPRVLGQLEFAAQWGQGKGWGASTLRQEVEACIKLLPVGCRSRPLVLDVGANVGDWTAEFLASSPRATLFCFEPSSSAFERLSARFADNPQVHLSQAAAGASPGTSQLWTDSPGSPLASLTRRRLDHLEIEFGSSEEVAVVDLDTWCRDKGVVPQVIKLDVEGHELDVLAGAGQILGKVSVVQFEFGGCNIDTRTYFQDFYNLFRDAGFRVFRLTPRGPLEVESYGEADECFQTTNYLAVAKRPR